jgi:hypothetical protein
MLNLRKSIMKANVEVEVMASLAHLVLPSLAKIPMTGYAGEGNYHPARFTRAVNFGSLSHLALLSPAKVPATGYAGEGGDLPLEVHTGLNFGRVSHRTSLVYIDT